MSCISEVRECDDGVNGVLEGIGNMGEGGGLDEGGIVPPWLEASPKGEEELLTTIGRILDGVEGARVNGGGGAESGRGSDATDDAPEHVAEIEHESEVEI